MIPDLTGEIGRGEEVRKVGITAFTVEMHEGCVVYRQAGAFQNVDLDCQVGDVFIVDSGGGLDFDDVEGSV
ncbi:hypothetical protein ES705_05512 [subsurface metagenome]